MLNKRSKVVFSSLKELAATAFSVVNYVAPNSTNGIPINWTLTSNTKTGVLGGSVAAYDGNYLVNQCTGANSGITATNVPCGLFVTDANPDNFMNAPGIASNKIPVAQFGGEFEVDVFETHAWTSAYASILANYVAGTALYPSKGGLLTTELPTAGGVGGTVIGSNGGVVARVTWAPVQTNLILGIDLCI